MTPEIVLGPPGTGKTTTLLNEVDAELARGVPPDRVAYLSFTRRAAEEAVTRACAKWGLEREALPHFRTLHSLAFRALGLSSSDVLQGSRLRDFADWAGLRLTARGAYDHEEGLRLGTTAGDRILHMENLARVRCCPLRELYDADDDRLPWDEVERVAGALAAHKHEHRLLDFTDMLSELTRTGAPPDIEVMVVDECQDLSTLQWKMVYWLARRCRRVIVAGDDDQAIYQWAGADVEQFVSMTGSVRVLGRSYRVPRAVQALAADVIGGVVHRREKAWEARDEPGGVDLALDVEELDLTPASAGGRWVEDVQPVLVLARNEYVLREQVVPHLQEAGVLFEWRGEQSVDLAVQHAVVAWEALRSGKGVAAALVRGVYSLMTDRGVDRAHRDLAGVPDDYELGLEEAERDYGLRTRAVWREALDRIVPDDAAAVVAAIKGGERLGERSRVRLSTIHGAKGGEARHVVLFREMARRSWREMARRPDEERRVWYVGITRARERLTVVEGTRREVCPWI